MLLGQQAGPYAVDGDGSVVVALHLMAKCLLPVKFKRCKLARSSSRLAVDWPLCLVTHNSRGKKISSDGIQKHCVSRQAAISTLWHGMRRAPCRLQVSQTNRLHLLPSSKDIVFEHAGSGALASNFT